MPRPFGATSDFAGDFLAAVGTSLCLLGFFGAILTALGKLPY